MSKAVPIQETPYLLFAGCRYYPRGGWADFQGSYPTLGTARAYALEMQAAADRNEIDWWHIVYENKVVLLASRHYRDYGSADRPMWWEETTEVWWEK